MTAASIQTIKNGQTGTMFRKIPNIMPVLLFAATRLFWMDLLRNTENS